MRQIVFLLTLLVAVLVVEAKNVHDFKVKSIEGKTVNLSQYKGKVLLIVNVASKCGFTYQYEGLQNLYAKYKNQGLVVLGFPCNQFMFQEPGSEAEIAQFCKLKYDVNFPLFSKINVNGKKADPLYKYLKTQLPGTTKKGDIEWNFTKFLIDKNGNPVSRHASKIKPEQLEEDIIILLTK